MKRHCSGRPLPAGSILATGNVVITDFVVTDDKVIVTCPGSLFAVDAKATIGIRGKKMRE